MNVIEAQDLALDIRLEAGARTDVRQIGNGEWIILLNYFTFIWSPADWRRFKKEGAQ